MMPLFKLVHIGYKLEEYYNHPYTDSQHFILIEYATFEDSELNAKIPVLLAAIPP